MIGAKMTKKASTGTGAKASTFSAGDNISNWTSYNIEEKIIQLNGEATKYKAILQNGDLAQIATKKYSVIPNEEAVKIAEMAAKETGMVPFHEFTGEWFNRLDNNIIQDGWRVHCLYALNEPYTVNGDKMHIGVGIHNSLDGTSPFGAGIFTFRHACSNMVLAGSRGYVQAFDERRTIDYIYQRHVGDPELLVTDIAQKITTLMERATFIVESYEQMAREKFEEENRKKFLIGLNKSKIPQKWLPDYLTVKPKEALPPIPEKITHWDVYNDITANVWHDKGQSQLRRRIKVFDRLHRLMPLTISGAN